MTVQIPGSSSVQEPANGRHEGGQTIHHLDIKSGCQKLPKSTMVAWLHYGLGYTQTQASVAAFSGLFTHPV